MSTFSKICESWHNIPPETGCFLKCRITNSLDGSEDDCAFSCTQTLHTQVRGFLQILRYCLMITNYRSVRNCCKTSSKVTLTLPKYCTLETHCLLLNKDFCCGKAFSSENQGAQYIQVCIIHR